MIKPGEIQKKAYKAGVRDYQIEKDYVLTWILIGISSHSGLKETIVFKGGTLLKKVYFEYYRFSEDLDFTLLDDNVSNEQIFDWFRETFYYIRDEANIPLEIIDNNEHEDGGINFYISYVGPLGGGGTNKKIKIDISRGEKLLFHPNKKELICNYSDQSRLSILCYTLEEILIEKLRSVIQRMQARDLFDIWYLLEINQMEIEYLLSEFKEKCQNKGIDPAEFSNKLAQRLPKYKGRWINSMSDQIKNLPEFDKVEREVMRQLKNLKF